MMDEFEIGQKVWRISNIGSARWKLIPGEVVKISKEEVLFNGVIDRKNKIDFYFSSAKWNEKDISIDLTQAKIENIFCSEKEARKEALCFRLEKIRKTLFEKIEKSKTEINKIKEELLKLNNEGSNKDKKETKNKVLNNFKNLDI